MSGSGAAQLPVAGLSRQAAAHDGAGGASASCWSLPVDCEPFPPPAPPLGAIPQATQALPCVLCRCTSRPTSEAFYAAVSSPDKHLNVVPGGYHEVLFSSDISDGLVQGMIEWIKQRAAGGAGVASAAKM